ncbi:MAG TPA: hypothetical protein VGG19_19995, partial [Tepidisphaeraceae bacterium]
FSGTTSGSFTSIFLPALPDGLAWDTSQLYKDGVIMVIPEPSLMTSVLGMIWLVSKRRRISPP